MKREIILASGSPRRKELLTLIGIPFRVIKSEAEEAITCTEPADIVMELSEKKAAEVSRQISDGIILGADTIVVLEGKIMGKPTDREDAKCMLQKLQGNIHSVFTGVTLIGKRSDREDLVHRFYRETRVSVHAMDDREIERYLATGDSLDKAGAYGIQGPFAAYIDGIEGDYQNVVGLPISAVYQELKQLVQQM